MAIVGNGRFFLIEEMIFQLISLIGFYIGTHLCDLLLSFFTLSNNHSTIQEDCSEYNNNNYYNPNTMLFELFIHKKNKNVQSKRQKILDNKVDEDYDNNNDILSTGIGIKLFKGLFSEILSSSSLLLDTHITFWISDWKYAHRFIRTYCKIGGKD